MPSWFLLLATRAGLKLPTLLSCVGLQGNNSQVLHLRILPYYFGRLVDEKKQGFDANVLENSVFLRADPQKLWAPSENKLSFLSHESLYRTGMCLLCCSILVKRLVTLSQLSTPWTKYLSRHQTLHVGFS